MVIGAGMGGLAAACLLAHRGHAVTVLERADAPGGKMRVVEGVDAGPTVFTMRWVFEALFAECGVRLDEAVGLTQAGILARHAWGMDRLDLHADAERSAAAIEAFAGSAEARGFRSFCAAAQRIYRTLEGPFIRGERPSMTSLALSVRPQDLLAIKPFASLWGEIGTHFRDPRLRQLFGRYATYCGSSPFLAPATLMLVADVEQQGVWYVDGGMHALARALAGLAAAGGAEIRYGADVAEIATEAGRVSGVRLASGEVVDADAVIANADPQAIASGRFGPAVQRAVPRQKPAERSLSALTWAGTAEVEGFPLVRHSVFFSPDYKAEFDALGRGAMAREPTVYICAQDRGDAGEPGGLERLLVLINAPPSGDARPMAESDTERYRMEAWALMERSGLRLQNPVMTTTGPAQFEALFPATGGALYGPAVHGATASFKRPASRTAVRGLYLAGGGAHPGAGVPMAALSGRLAASALMADLGSISPSRMTVTAGGMSTR